MPNLRPEQTLTEKERFILDCLVHGLKNRQIAAICENSEQGIKNRLRRIFDKIGCHTRLEAAMWWLARGKELYNRESL